MFAFEGYQLVLGAIIPVLLAAVYLSHINALLSSVPPQVKRIASDRWATEDLQKLYQDLESHPISSADKLPTKLDRRYVITGGHGLIGGYIVLQLLARGTPPAHIRILDLREPERSDLMSGDPRAVDYVKTDITSKSSVAEAFSREWHPSAAQLPLTVFHTAAVILASDRSSYLYAFPESVNVKGTEIVLNAARAAGADIFIATSSASIGIRAVQPFVLGAGEPKYFWQMLDERDFWKPLRPANEFFGNYPYSKAVAERLVCGANSETFRTGTIRPANGVYGHPSDNVLGAPLGKDVFPTWVPHIIQSFVHAANIAVAHLEHEAVLATKGHKAPQAARPFVVTDPNPPISYQNLYDVIGTLSVHPFRTLGLPPVVMLLLSHVVEWYFLLSYRLPFTRHILPQLTGDLRELQPGLFSICTHLVGVDSDARKPVDEGGLGHKGIYTTMQGMVTELVDWNREHRGESSAIRARKKYLNSVSAAEKVRLVLWAGGMQRPPRVG